MSVINVNLNNFDEEVLKSNIPVIVDFWASWCGPCRMVGPILEEIANEHPEIKVVKINVDEQGELASSFGIMSIPTLMVFKNGEVVNKSVGVKTKNEILGML